jgi:hypothetical protein
MAHAEWTVIAAVNNEEILADCLLRSPEVKPGANLILQRGFGSAALAYNSGIAQAKTDVVIMAHQDMFFPSGWFANMEATIHGLAQTDPNWGVLGIWGVDNNGDYKGHLHCTASRRTLGEKYVGAKRVRTLDEVVLAVRKGSDLRFDVSLPGFHLYGTDICLAAEQLGLSNYALSAFCIHNSNGYAILPWSFWKNYFYLRRKWSNRLPVITPCIKINSWCGPVLWRLVVRRWMEILLRRHQPGKRVGNPAKLCAELIVSSPDAVFGRV